VRGTAESSRGSRPARTAGGTTVELTSDAAVAFAAWACHQPGRAIYGCSKDPNTGQRLVGKTKTRRAKSARVKLAPEPVTKAVMERVEGKVAADVSKTHGTTAKGVRPANMSKDDWVKVNQEHYVTELYVASWRGRDTQ
jgi:hypothetical protein